MFKFNFTNILLVFSVISTVFLSSCTKINENVELTPISSEPVFTAYPVEVCGIEFQKSPESVISLSPALTEILFELKINSRLIGRSDYCDFPSETSAIESFGSSVNPDIQAIKSAKPKLLISQSPIAKKDISTLNSAGISVVIFDTPSNITEINDIYLEIATIFFGKIPNEKESSTENAFVAKTLEKQAEFSGKLGKFLVITSPEITVANENSIFTSVLDGVGTNVCISSETKLSAEEILEKSPDVIILPSYLSAEILPEELAEIKVIVLDEECSRLIERPTSRVFNVIDFICKS